MVWGTSSWAGKSLITTVLCRHLARRGVRVAPFKAQNMSNNARVVDGGEIGVAQWLQARAAGVEPDVRMNPVLVKPEADTRSQVVVLGAADLELSRRPWRERGPALWPVVEESLRSTALSKALRSLPERHRSVLVLRFGLEDTEPQTLEDIGRTLGLTRERVRQIEVDALRRLASLREMAAVVSDGASPRYGR